MGFMHADQPNRDSLACDLMEAVRPEVDGFVLNLLRTRTFSTKDFFETRVGVCRVLPPLTHLVAETAPQWAGLVAPVAEEVARALQGKRAWRQQERTLPTPLTQGKRSAGRSVRRAIEPRPAKTVSTLPKECATCGAVLPSSSRRYCDECWPDEKVEQGRRASALGPRALAHLRAAGQDPAHGNEAARKRGSKNAEHIRAAALWKAEEPPIDFQREILPKLQTVLLSAIMRATGLSKRYCWLVRRGTTTPHPRHWDPLARLTEAGNLNEGR